MKNDFEQILQQVLVPSDEPDDCLNRNIIDSVKKMQTDGLEMEVAMRKAWYKSVPAIILAAAAVVCVGGFSARAAWKYLKPEQAVEKTGDQKLAEVFKEGNSISINERQTYGGYTVTLLGMTSGKNISKFEYESNGEIKDDRTYAVVAIENEDGTRMAETDRMDALDEDTAFLVSPLIHGEDPRFVNIYCMNGGGTTFLEDGIMYRVIDCDNLEVFAKRGVYLSVNTSSFFDSEGYHFDKESGEITRNEDYTGLNALFRLPLDESKADEAAAEEQLRQWQEEMDADDEEEEDVAGTEDDDEAVNFVIKKIGAGEDIDEGKAHPEWNPETLEKYAEIIPESVETLKADQDGYIYTKTWSYSEGSDDQVSVGTSKLLVNGKDGLFPEKGFVGMSECMNIFSGTNKKEIIITYTRNEDGTITVAAYHEQ